MASNTNGQIYKYYVVLLLRISQVHFKCICTEFNTGNKKDANTRNKQFKYITTWLLHLPISNRGSYIDIPPSRKMIFNKLYMHEKEIILFCQICYHVSYKLECSHSGGIPPMSLFDPILKHSNKVDQLYNNT